MMPCWHFWTSPSAACSSLRMIFSTSSPTYPASVRVVASTIANGTSSILASVCASSVLPDPILIQERLHLLRLRKLRRRYTWQHLAAIILEDRVAYTHALIAYVGPRII